jgi:cobalt-zinc-cadmium efflux system outer membrane protein
MKFSVAVFSFLAIGMLTASARAQDNSPKISTAPLKQAGPEALSLSAVLLRARDNNPDIQAARQAWRAKEADIRPAGTWDNPTFSYTDENFPSGVAGVPTEKIRHYRIEQMIPFPGKLTGEARMKYHEALIAESEYRAKLLEVLRDVRMRYYQLYLTDQQILLAAQSVDILKDALRTAQARVGSNQSSTSDIFMAETELGKMNNALFEAQQARLLVQFQLNRLLKQSTDTPLGLAQPPELKDLPVALADLQTLAHRNDPSYLAAIHEIEHAQAMLTRTKLNYAPDFGLMYEREESPDGPAGRQIGISVSFPLWLQRPWGQVESAKAHILEAEANSQSMQDEVDQMVHMEFIETTTHLRLSRNFINAILPSAASNVKIARQQYASGQSDFVRMLEAFRSWIDVHDSYEEELYHYGEHWSELERWTGVDLDHAKEALEQNQIMPMEMHHEK